MRLLVKIFIIFLLLGAEGALAIQYPQSDPADPRIRFFVYRPKEVYIFTGHYRYQSAINFEKNESITNILMGDSTGWSIVPAVNKIFLKPVDRDATTNMTIITNKRTYLFELYAEEAEGIRDEEISLAIDFRYVDTSDGAIIGGTSVDAGIVNFGDTAQEEIGFLEQNQRNKLNYNYTLSGHKFNAPSKIFDDGTFTYMQFADRNAEIPAIYDIGYDGVETIVNYRVEGDYIVVERVASQYTLRNGEYVTCVFNESKPLERPKKYKKNIVEL